MLRKGIHLLTGKNEKKLFGEEKKLGVSTMNLYLTIILTACQRENLNIHI